MKISVDRRQLGPMTELDSGAFGVVHRLTAYSLPGFEFTAFKEYRKPLNKKQSADLSILVGARALLETRHRAVLDSTATWPLQLVTDRGAVVGFVMQLIPSDFFSELLLPSGKKTSLPTKVQWLFVSPAKADAAQIQVLRAEDLPERLVLCAKLAHVLGVLHRAGFVYGDMSHNNVMFTAVHPPRIMLVDCDDVQAAGSAGGPSEQGNTPDWFPPEISSGAQSYQDIETDRYKLAVFTLRCLAPGSMASVSVDPNRMLGILNLRGNEMIKAGLGTVRAARPTAKEWYSYLTGYIDELTRPPTISAIRVDQQVVTTGTVVTVEWQVSGAQSIKVVASDTFEKTYNQVSTDHGSVQMAVTRSGPFTVTAVNPYGATSVSTSPIVVFEPPRIEYVRIPEPPIPVVGDNDWSSSTSEIANVLVISGSPFEVSLPPMPSDAAITRTGADIDIGFRWLTEWADVGSWFSGASFEASDFLERVSQDAFDLVAAARENALRDLAKG